jgi:LEA14-like dessication related protein
MKLKTSNLIILIVSSFGLSLFACKPKPKVVVKAKRVFINKITLDKLFLTARYEITNPHPVAITIVSADQNFKLDQKDISTGKLEKKVKIPAKKAENIDINMVIKLENSLKPVGQLILGKKVDYSHNSTFKIETPVGNETRRMLREGVFRLPLKPGGGLVGIKNLKLENSKIKMELLMKIPLPRVELMETTIVQYNFSIENTKIAAGKFNLKKDGKSDFQTVKIPVQWPLDKAAGWGIKSTLSKVDYQFRLNFDLGQETEFVIEQKDSFNLKKLSPSYILKYLISQ